MNTVTNRSRPAALLALLLSIHGVVGCEDNRSPLAPSGSSPAVAQPTPFQPTVTLVTPSTGSTAGDAWGRITGAGFQRGATVTLGAIAIRNLSFEDSTTIYFPGSGPHAAGAVDVTVTNPGGLASTLRGGYTYAPPESFDINGQWAAQAGPDFETTMRFTIRENVLVSLSCGASGTLAPWTSLAAGPGQFAFASAGGLVVAGKQVSPITASGTINVPDCTLARWWAIKQ